MTITPIIEEPCFGTKITYYLIKPKAPTNVCMICLHGQGELGPLDGTDLPEALKLGWPMHAKNGFEFPWNMIVPQSQIDHRNLVKILVPYVKLKYKASGLFVTGLSLGGYGTYDAVLYDTLGLIDAIAPVCGSGRLASVASYGRMKAFHIHGENDSTVKWNTARAFIEKYNETALWPIKFHLYPGIGHNVWNQAYSIKPGEDELYQWFLERIEELPAEPLNTQAMKDKIIEFVKTL